MEAVREVRYVPDFKYYLCRRCDTHIVLLRDCTHVHTRIVQAATLDNVVIASSCHVLDSRIIADVNCSGCLKQLGWKCIQAGNNRSYLFEEGKFGLLLKSLLFWDGEQILDAKTLQPWDGNTMEAEVHEEWELTDDLT